MTWETYDKARELSEQMDYITELEATMINSAAHIPGKERMLAAITVEEYEDARKIIVTKCKVLNHVHLSEEFKDKFVALLREEHDRISEEFKNL